MVLRLQTNKGVDEVEKHIARFDHDVGNDFMIDRLRKIADGKLEATQCNLNYYTHELYEFQRYKNLGWEVGQPQGDAGYDILNNAHTVAVEDYCVKDKNLFL